MGSVGFPVWPGAVTATDLPWISLFQTDERNGMAAEIDTMTRRGDFCDESARSLDYCAGIEVIRPGLNAHPLRRRPQYCCKP